MINQSVSVSSATQSDPIRIDSNLSQIAAGILLVFSNTATATVEFTYDRPNTDPNDATAAADNWAAADWYDMADFTALTATANGLIDTPVMGVRIDCTSHTSGTVTLTVNQGNK